MTKLLSALVAGLFALVLGVAAVAAGTTETQAPPSAVALEEIPADLLPVYQEGAARCPGLPWQVLAAIGAIESNHAQGGADHLTGEVDPPILGPALDGSPGVLAIPDASFADGWAHALGPMQFLPSTWERWATLASGRPAGAVPSPHNAWDAIHSAALLLCGGRPEVGDLEAAVYAYNHSQAYVDQVLATATAYGLGASVTAASTGTASGDAVVAAAMSALGVPYVWGGASPETGFDCSGLVQWAYAQVGITLPRTTSEQIGVGVAVGDNELQLGDLLFSRGGVPPHDLGHVAIYTGGGMQVVAPRTGEVVSLRPVDTEAVQAVRRVLS